MSPSNPHDAYWMIRKAIESNDPVLYFEPKSRYWPKGPVNLDHAGLPLHASRVVREGTDVTVVGHGAMVATLLQAAEIAAEEGRSLEVVDLRSISPIDYGPLLDSVQRTGRLVVAQEAYGNVSVGSEIAATVAERAFYALEAPPCFACRASTPPPSRRPRSRPSSCRAPPTGCSRPSTGHWRTDATRARSAPDRMPERGCTC